MTQADVIAWVCQHPGCLTADVAAGLAVSTHTANAHLTRAVQAGRLTQTGSGPYRWHPVARPGPKPPVSLDEARARLAEIPGMIEDLQDEAAALDAYIGAYAARRGGVDHA